ncbi:MAG: AMP-binding protein [Patescibacteria group bacterium]
MKTLIDLFSTFQDNSHAPVFVYRTGVRRFEYSYGWLDQAARSFATWLEQQGIQKGEKVLLWAPNSPWWAVVYWGCVLRGAVVVPVDFTSNKARAQQIADLSESTLALVSKYKVDAQLSLKTAVIEDVEFMLPDSRGSSLVEVVDTDLVEIVYTSGTTGDPKGVMLTHKNLITNLKQVAAHITLEPGYRFLSVLPLSHMFEQLGGFLVTFMFKGSIVYVRTIKPSALLAAFNEEDISVMMAVPRLLSSLKASIERKMKTKRLDSLFEKLLTKADSWSQKKKKVIFYPVHKTFGKSFQFFVSGGAALSPDVALFWKRLGFVVIEGYGLTECSPLVCANTLEHQEIGSVGIPVKDIDIRVEDNELQVRGENVFDGYYKNKEKTQEAFTEDGWFKTGDMATIEDDGSVQIRGRKQEMIVTSAGVNVYPSDIEPLLQAHDGIKEGCVIAKKAAHGDEVHAVVVPEENSDIANIINEVNTKLDDTQQISGWTVWSGSELPKTTTLKVQKKKIQLVLEQESGSEELTSQDKLISIIARVTGESENTITPDTYIVKELGLSSLARLELVSLLEQEYRLDLDDSIITLTTTVRDLEKIITDRGGGRKDKFAFAAPITPVITMIRKVLDLVLHIPFVKLFLFSLKVKGKEHLQDIKGPVIFAANHADSMDAAAVFLALPRRIRYRTVTTALESIFFRNGSSFMNMLRRVYYHYAARFFAAVPVTLDTEFRQTLTFLGGLVDKNYNIILFPEGDQARHKTEDVLDPFFAGLGIIVKELKVPVVPIRIYGVHEIKVKKKRKFPKLGKVQLVFGKPLYFTNEQPHQIVETTYQAIEDLIKKYPGK